MCIFNVVEVCGCIFICFYIGFTRSKNSYNAVLCSIWMHHSAKYRELSLKPEAVQTIFKYRELSLKPEAVQTIFKYVPQPKGFDNTQTLD